MSSGFYELIHNLDEKLGSSTQIMKFDVYNPSQFNNLGSGYVIFIPLIWLIDGPIKF